MDNRIEAKKHIKELLHTDLGYIFKETNVGRHRIHLTFKMDSRTHELQMTFDFAEKYCDILTFISPRVLTDEYYDETLYTINTINTYVKAFGRFYVDDYNDIGNNQDWQSINQHCTCCVTSRIDVTAEQSYQRKDHQQEGDDKHHKRKILSYSNFSHSSF